MERQVEHMVRLVDDLLDVSRVMRGKIELRRERVELATVVARAVDRIVEFGCKVVQVVGIVDRLEGGAENFAARDLPFSSLLTIKDFGITPPPRTGAAQG